MTTTIKPRFLRALFADPVTAFAKVPRRPVIVVPMHHDALKSHPKIALVAEPSGEVGSYHERTVCAFNAKGVQVADFLVGLNSKTSELRVLVTAGGEGEARPKTRGLIAAGGCRCV